MKELVELAKKLGLNEYESKAYVSLSKLGSAQVSEISKYGGIPRARVYDVLESLSGKGFAAKRPTKPVEYAALAPLQALAMLKERRTLGLEKEFKELAKVSEILEKNASSGAQTGTATAVGGVWSLPGGRTGIYEKIAQELSNTSETIVFCSTKRGIKRKTNAFRHKLDFLSKKGVKVVFNASSQGARFVVFDKNKAVLFLDPDGTDSEKERAVLIESPHFAGYLSNACRK